MRILNGRCPAAIALLVAMMGLSTVQAAEFDVTVAADPGDGLLANTLSWAIAQANANADEDVITLATDVLLTGPMRVMIDSDLILRSDATRRSIDGDNSYRPLFIRSGAVSIQFLDIINGHARGGDSSRGGGGAGLGGAVFVLDGEVQLTGVALINNSATGGAGGSSGVGAGGGISGDGFGDGGGGLIDPSAGLNGAGAGDNGGAAGLFDNGTDGGFGGGGGSSAFAAGGNGGFGAGGGSGMNGGNGGFGGGGGAGELGMDPGGIGGNGGNGGFGGGGGYGAFQSGLGGYGGATAIGGGGGAGFGGAIFAMGGITNLINVEFIDNGVEPGQGGEPLAAGGDVFICTADIHSTAALCNAEVNADANTNPDDVFGNIGVYLPVDLLFEDRFEGE